MRLKDCIGRRGEEDYLHPRKHPKAQAERGVVLKTYLMAFFRRY